MHLKMLTAALTCAAMAAAAAAHDFTKGDLIIKHPVAAESLPGARAGAGYLTITNNGDTADRLIEIRTGMDRTEVHTTQMTDGVARMMPVGILEIPAGETVTLEPGGMHVMFMGLGGDALEAGEELPATLVFDAGGEVEVVFVVEPRGDGSEGRMDHSIHDGEAKP